MAPSPPGPRKPRFNQHGAEIASVQRNPSDRAPIPVGPPAAANADAIGLTNEPARFSGRQLTGLALARATGAITGLRRINIFQPDTFTGLSNFNRVAIDDAKANARGRLLSGGLHRRRRQRQLREPKGAHERQSDRKAAYPASAPEPSPLRGGPQCRGMAGALSHSANHISQRGLSMLDGSETTLLAPQLFILAPAFAPWM